MAARDVRKNLNLWVDGRGFAGQIDEFNAPELALQTEEYRGGGMDAPVDINMGMEKLVSDFSLISYDRGVLALFGLREGQSVPLIVREALESSDGTVTGVVHTLRGKIVRITPGTSKPGTLQPLKVDMSLNYYKLTHGGIVVHEIDVVNMVRTVNGVDTLEAIRIALGM